VTIPLFPGRKTAGGKVAFRRELRKRCFQADCAEGRIYTGGKDAASEQACWRPPIPLLHPHPRINQRVADVHQQVRHHHGGSGKDRRGHDHRQVLRGDGLHRLLAEPG